jgi:hypothetical protein
VLPTSELFFYKVKFNNKEKSDIYAKVPPIQPFFKTDSGNGGPAIATI